MIINILEKMDMGKDFSTESFDLIYTNIYDKTKQYCSNLAIYWDNAQGIYDAKLEIYISNDELNWAKAEEIEIIQESNKNDIHIYFIDEYIKFIKFKYFHYSILSGEISANLSFLEK